MSIHVEVNKAAYLIYHIYKEVEGIKKGVDIANLSLPMIPLETPYIVVMPYSSLFDNDKRFSLTGILT